MNLMSVVLVRPGLRKEVTSGNLAPRKMRPQSRMALGENVYKRKNADKATLYSSIEAKAMPPPTSKSPQEREFEVDSEVPVYMLSKKVLSSDELDTLQRSRNHTVVVTANEKCIQTRKHKYKFTILISS